MRQRFERTKRYTLIYDKDEKLIKYKAPPITKGTGKRNRKQHEIIIQIQSIASIINSMTGTRIAVIIPITPIANPLIAPSIVPSSMARAVPRPWAAEPNANPGQYGFLFPVFPE